MQWERTAKELPVDDLHQPTLDRPYLVDAPARLKLIDVETDTPTVIAQFNPKEVAIDRQVSWTEVKATKRAADLEFTGAPPRSMSLELLFDGYELGESIQPYLDSLDRLCRVVPALKRPPRVKVIWGSDSGDMPPFVGPIASCAIKYQMWSPSGIVLRATASIKLTEGRQVGVGRQR